jgi:hypothetical protein
MMPVGGARVPEPAAGRQPSIYEPGSTAGQYSTRPAVSFDLGGGAPAAGGGGQAGWNTYGGGQSQADYFASPGRQVGYGGGSPSVSQTSAATKAGYAPDYHAGSTAALQRARARKAAGGGGGGGGGSLEQQVLDEVTRSYNEGLEVNQQRYDDIVGGYRDRYGTTMEMIGQVGDAQRAEVDRSYAGLASQAQQQLVDKGLAGSSIAPTTAAGVERERLRARQEVEEGLLREKIAAHGGQSGETLEFMERSEDTYPDIGQVADLAMKLGNVGGGGGGGGGVAVAAPAQFGYQIPGQAYGTGPAYPGYNAGGGYGGGGGNVQQLLANATQGILRAGQDPALWRRKVQAGQNPHRDRDFQQLDDQTQMIVFQYYRAFNGV